MIEPLRGWTPATMRSENQEYLVNGVNVWTADWIPLHQRLVIAHPTYRQQRHEVDVYELRVDDLQVGFFAAGEMSVSAWAFCQPA